MTPLVQERPQHIALLLAGLLFDFLDETQGRLWARRCRDTATGNCEQTLTKEHPKKIFGHSEPPKRKA
jgi:hypothetical protein